MKHLFKILVLLVVAAYFHSTFNPIKQLIAIALNSQNSDEEESLLVITNATGYLSGIQLSKTIEMKPIQSNYFSRQLLKLKSNSQTYLLRKEYNVNNLLQYNLPYICFKFPLSEHTEEG